MLSFYLSVCRLRNFISDRNIPRFCCLYCFRQIFYRFVGYETLSDICQLVYCQFCLMVPIILLFWDHHLGQLFCLTKLSWYCSYAYMCDYSFVPISYCLDEFIIEWKWIERWVSINVVGLIPPSLLLSYLSKFIEYKFWNLGKVLKIHFVFLY